jgi:hypothetical protein
MGGALARIAVLFAPLVLAACAPASPHEPWLEPAVPVDNPAASGSRYPRLARAADGTVVMSWLAPAAAGHELRYAYWGAGGFGAPAVVASGEDWFVNWADFPSVVPGPDGLLAAHWLRRLPGNAYAYEVRLAISGDGGRHWSAPLTPHDDGTPTEHGFVSLLPTDGGVLAAWLDGRRTSAGHDHAEAGGGATMLRALQLARDGRGAGPGVELDPRTCDCCQTDAAATDDGVVLVYRDRGPDEVRDVALVRLDGGRWSEPVRVHADGWRIEGCPVNGPAVAARGRTVVVAWFTSPDVPRVRLAFSNDAGRSFGPPLEVAQGSVTGRVDVVLLDGGRAVVSWLEGGTAGAALRARPFTRDGAAGAAVSVAAASVQRTAGFPQMVRAGDGLLFAWTDAAAPQQVRTAFARLP